MKTLVMIGWVKREKDLSSSPAGVSFHLNNEDAEAFTDEYWERLEEENGGRIPESYSYPVSYNPRVVKAYGNLYERVAETKNGLYISQYELEEMEG